MLAGALSATVIAVVMWLAPLSWKSQALFTINDIHCLGWKIFSHTVFSALDVFAITMMVALFSCGYSLFTIPYTGQGYELTTDYNERTHLFKWRQYAYACAGFLTPWLPWMCIKLDIISGIAPLQANGLHGVRWVGIFVGAVVLLTALAPILGCSEVKSVQRDERKASFLSAIRFAAKNKAFWPLVLSNFLLKFGMVSTGIFFTYLLIYHVAGGDKQAGTQQWGIFCNVINVATFIAMAPVVKLTDKIGKKHAILFLMAVSVFAYASVWFTFQPHPNGAVPGIAGWLTDVLGIPGAISKAWPVYITGAGIGIFCNCMPMIMNSMLADVCDVDELASGHQRQAFYGAIFVTCDKIAMGVAMLLQGFLLSSSGFDPSVLAQKSGTIAFWLKALLFSQPTGFVLGFLIVMTYPITHLKALETRRLLDERNKVSGI